MLQGIEPAPPLGRAKNGSLIRNSRQAKPASTLVVLPNMKTQNGSGLARSSFFKRFAAAVLVLLLLTGWLLTSHSQLAPDVRDKDVMKFKLHYAQGVLEAIATENYPLLATNAQKLTQLSKQASWKLRQTPEYERFTTDFRRQTEALAKAAKDQNADAATVAYFQMTVACVTSHKYLRGRDVAFTPQQQDVLRTQLTNKVVGSPGLPARPL